VITAFLRWCRYRRHLRRAYDAKACAGYRVSDASYREMQRQARAYADGGHQPGSVMK
jgi:hypothetical protein